MPFVKVPDGEIYYETYGSGFPVMTFAPAGQRSSIKTWAVAADDANPVRIDPLKEFSSDFMVIAMDQRQAGQSKTTVKASDGWHTHVADALAVMDAVGVKKAHMVGCCIGPSFALALHQNAPERVISQIAWNPMGRSEQNQAGRLKGFEGWIKEVRETRPELDEAAMLKYRENLYHGDFVYSVDRDFVKQCNVPMLVMPGSDNPHPEAIGEEIGELAPRVEWFRDWKHHCPEQKQRMLTFLHTHTPRA